MSLISTAKGFMKWFVPPLLTRIAGFHTSVSDIGAVEYVANQCNCYLDSTVARAADQVMWVPFTAPDSPSSCSRLAVHITTAGTGGALLKMALASSSDLKLRFGGEVQGPCEIIGQTAALDASSTGLKTHTFGTPIPLVPGRVYWIGLINNESITYRGYTNFTSFALGFNMPQLAHPVTYYADTAFTTYATAWGPLAGLVNIAQATFGSVSMRYILV